MAWKGRYYKDGFFGHNFFPAIIISCLLLNLKIMKVNNLILRNWQRILLFRENVCGQIYW